MPRMRLAAFMVAACVLLHAAWVSAWDCDGARWASAVNLEVGNGESKTYSARNCEYSSAVSMRVRSGTSGELNYRFENCVFSTGAIEISDGNFRRLTLAIQGGNGIPLFRGGQLSDSNITLVRPVSASVGTTVVTMRGSSFVNTEVHITADPDEYAATGRLAPMPELVLDSMTFGVGSSLVFERLHVVSWSSVSNPLRLTGGSSFHDAAWVFKDTRVGSHAESVGINCQTNPIIRGPRGLLHVTNGTLSTQSCQVAENATVRLSGPVFSNNVDLRAAITNVESTPDMYIRFDADCPGIRWRDGRLLPPLVTSGPVGMIRIELSQGAFTAQRANFTSPGMHLDLPASATLAHCSFAANANISAASSVSITGAAVRPTEVTTGGRADDVPWTAAMGAGSTVQGSTVTISNVRMSAGNVTVRTTNGGFLRVSRSWLGPGAILTSAVSSAGAVFTGLDVSDNVFDAAAVRIVGVSQGAALGDGLLTEAGYAYLNNNVIANGSAFHFERLHFTAVAATGAIEMKGNTFPKALGSPASSISVLHSSCKALSAACFHLGDGTVDHRRGAIGVIRLNNVTAHSGRGFVLFVAADATFVTDARLLAGAARFMPAAAESPVELTDVLYGRNLEHALPPPAAMPTSRTVIQITETQVEFIDARWSNAVPTADLRVSSHFQCTRCDFPRGVTVSVGQALTLTDWSAGDGSNFTAARVEARTCNASSVIRGLALHTTAAGMQSIVTCTFHNSLLRFDGATMIELMAVKLHNGSAVDVRGRHYGVGVPPIVPLSARLQYIYFTSYSLVEDSSVTITGVSMGSNVAYQCIRFMNTQVLRSSVCITNASNDHVLIGFVYFAQPVVNSTVALAHIRFSGGATRSQTVLDALELKGTTNVTLFNVSTVGAAVRLKFDPPHLGALTIHQLRLQLDRHRGAEVFTPVDVPVFEVPDAIEIGGLSPFDVTVSGGITTCPPHLVENNTAWTWPQGSLTIRGGEWGGFCSSVHLTAGNLIVEAPTSLPAPLEAFVDNVLRITGPMKPIERAHFTVGSHLSTSLGTTVTLNTVKFVNSSVHIEPSPAALGFLSLIAFEATGSHFAVEGHNASAPSAFGYSTLQLGPAGLVDCVVVYRNLRFDPSSSFAAIKLTHGPVHSSLVVLDSVSAIPASTLPLMVTDTNGEFRNASIVLRSGVFVSSSLQLVLMDSNLTIVNSSIGVKGLQSTRASGRSSIVVRGGEWPMPQTLTIGGASWFRISVAALKRTTSRGFYVRGAALGQASVGTADPPSSLTLAWDAPQPTIHSASEPTSGGSVSPCTTADVGTPRPHKFVSRIFDEARSSDEFKLLANDGSAVHFAGAMSCKGLATATGFDTWSFTNADGFGGQSDAQTILRRVNATKRRWIEAVARDLLPPAPIPAVESTAGPLIGGIASECSSAYVGYIGDDAGQPHDNKVTLTPSLERASASGSKTVTVSAAEEEQRHGGRTATRHDTTAATHELSAPPVIDGVTSPSRSSSSCVGCDASLATSTIAVAPERTSTAIVDVPAADLQAANLDAADSRVPTPASRAASVVSGVAGVSVTAPNKAGTTSRIVTAALRCGSEASGDEGDWPDWTSVVLVVPLAGSGTAARAAGAAMTTCLLALVASVALAVLHHHSALASAPATAVADAAPVPPPQAVHPWTTQRFGCATCRSWLQQVGVLFALVHSYYGPSAMEAAVYAAAHGENAVQVAVAAAAIVVRYATFVPAAVAVYRAEPGSSSAAPPLGAACFPVFALFEPSRDHLKTVVRLVIVVDVAVADLVAVLTGLQPGTNAGCSLTIYAILAVLLAGLAYLLAVRPYASTLEQWIMVALAALQASLAVAVIAKRNDVAGDDTVSLVATAVDGATLLGIAVLTVDAIVASIRRRRSDGAAATARKEGELEDALLGDVPTRVGGPPPPRPATTEASAKGACVSVVVNPLTAAPAPNATTGSDGEAPVPTRANPLHR